MLIVGLALLAIVAASHAVRAEWKWTARARRGATPAGGRFLNAAASQVSRMFLGTFASAVTIAGGRPWSVWIQS